MTFSKWSPLGLFSYCPDFSKADDFRGLVRIMQVTDIALLSDAAD